MGQRILIAEQQEVVRTGLHTILAENPRVSYIQEVATEQDLRTQIFHHVFDLIIINQELITNILLLPAKKFAVIAAEFNIAMLKAAYRHQARGYLSVSAPAELLHAMLRSAEETFLLDPTLAPWIMENSLLAPPAFPNEALFTPREREILELLRTGIDRSIIAQRLNIAETTLKTHIKNIAKKRERATKLQELQKAQK